MSIQLICKTNIINILWVQAVPEDLFLPLVHPVHYILVPPFHLSYQNFQVDLAHLYLLAPLDHPVTKVQ